ncbi:MAG: Cof-type HAD-IIB family hydrolase [Actinomycetota bacterium]|nr:HAD family phosphatase [Acidimicrobiia bacterium]MDQ3293412.1 Cof-type HAD-IIB family hydrolase [Actinomycetota bacterium]
MGPPTPPRLVACDLDGTLIARDNVLSPRVDAAVSAAIDAGLWVVAVTGRPWQITLEIARAHRLLPAAVCSNGGVLVDVESGKVEHTGLEDGAVAGLIDRVRDAVPGVVFAVDTVDRLVHEPEFMDAGLYWDPGEGPGDLAPHLDADVIKVIARRPGMPAEVLAGLLDHEVLAGAAAPGHGGGEWVELMPVGVSKASGLALLCERLGVDAAEVVAVGDEWNDVAMVEWAGTGVAVGDAPAALLAAADRVVPSAADDGVAALLEELVGDH